MGGITRAVEKAGQQLGIVKKTAPAAPQPAASSGAAPSQPPAAVTQQRERAEEIVSRRRARRGGRALLSEARLSPEEGIGQTTLGAGQM